MTLFFLGLQAVEWFLHGDANFLNKGSLVESFVGQELLAYSDPHTNFQLYYWQREQKGSEAEIDYLIQLEAQIIPIEVKSAKGNSLKSMRLFLDIHSRTLYVD